eukprot:jgi/Ulvmu1/5420/UM022_0215.1
MSLGYAEKLSYRDDVGAVGQKEYVDDGEVVEVKCQELAQLLMSSRKTIIMTGAGISTACGIPDFRGPNGVWTCQKHGRPLPKLDTTFASAIPSLTHMCVVGLLRDGPAQYLVSQNVDGLHRRSGIPESQLAEVHGNCFMERCPNCGTYYMRDFEMVTVGFKPTGRKCTKGRCRGHLRDQVLDWEDALPEEQLEAAESHANTADLVLCLGTSLQIRPICNLPLSTKRNGGKVVIVNLQKTPKNKAADVVIHAKCDEVLERVMHHMGRNIPYYDRWENFHMRFWLMKPNLTKKRGRQESASNLQGMLTVALTSSHGQTCPMPMLESLEWQFCMIGTAGGDGNWVSQRTKSSVQSNAAISENFDLADTDPSSGQDISASSSAGDAYVAGAEGPAIMQYKLPENGDSQSDSIQLQLTLHLGQGADINYRTHMLEMRIRPSVLKTCDAKAKMDAVWAAAEHGAVHVSLLSQVRHFGGDEKRELEGSCKWTSKHPVAELCHHTLHSR